MGKNTVNISPLIENQKVEIRVEEIINDTEVLTLHKYSLDGEKYQIKIKLNPNDEPEIICEEGNGKIIRKVKKIPLVILSMPLPECSFISFREFFFDMFS